MVKLIYLTAFFLLSSFSSDYNFNYRKLKFNDFREVLSLGDAVALSSTGISFDYEIRGENVKYFVEAKFYPRDSYIVKGHFNKNVLSHEQRHFDITKIYADILLYKLNKVKGSSEKLIQSVYANVTEEWDYVQELYDSETDHSRNELNQKEWDEILNNALNKDYLYLENKLGRKINF